MKKFLRRVFWLITISVTIVYLLSCLTPYIDPVDFWPMTFLALGFPVTAAGLLMFVIIWFFLRKKISLILLVVFLCGFSNIQSTFAFRLPSAFNYRKDSSHLRVLTWNVRDFDNCARHADSPNSIRRRMINYLKEVDADVLMFQEYMEYTNPLIYSNIQTMDSLGFHYNYTTRDVITYPSYGATFFGCAIFSKFPIIDSGKIGFENLPLQESVAFSDIMFNNKRVRLLTTHLASMNLRKSSEKREDAFFIAYDSAFSFTNPLYRKLIYYDSLHSGQAKQIKTLLSKSPYPVILSGDLNSVPSSYVYHTTKGKMKDVFIEKGSGWGRTYSTISPTLRIDCIFVDRRLSVSQWDTPELYLSDHFPVVADIHFK